MQPFITVLFIVVMLQLCISLSHYLYMTIRDMYRESKKVKKMEEEE